MINSKNLSIKRYSKELYEMRTRHLEEIDTCYLSFKEEESPLTRVLKCDKKAKECIERHSIELDNWEKKYEKIWKKKMIAIREGIEERDFPCLRNFIRFILSLLCLTCLKRRKK